MCKSVRPEWGYIVFIGEKKSFGRFVVIAKELLFKRPEKGKEL
jgi:hypothetical protein